MKLGHPKSILGVSLNGKKYWCVLDERYNSQAVHDSFHVIYARKLKMPKTAKANSAVVWNYGSNMGVYTALEIHNKRRKECNLKLAKDPRGSKEAKRAISKD